MSELLDRVEDLPALPSSSSRLVAVLSGGDPDWNEVERVVRVDEAISVAILREANSVRYGRPGRVFSLRESIGRLGTKALTRIAVQHGAARTLRDGGASYGLRRNDLWRGALGGALVAEEMARAHGFAEPELCFVGALLRDIGKLALSELVDQERLVAALEAAPADEDFLAVERRVLGADHAELGAEMAVRWNLPERVIGAIRHHHAPPPPGPGHDTMIDLVHAGDVVCLWTGLATGVDGLRYPIAPHVRAGILPNRAAAEHFIAVMWNRFTDIEAEIAEPAPRGMSA